MAVLPEYSSPAIDPATADRERSDVLSELEKSLPVSAAGSTVAEFLSSRPHLSAFSTPLLVLDDSALNGNVAQLAAWCADHGVGLAPHGKTTMAPALWQRQLAAGAWGITLANVSQLRVAAAFGVRRMMLANALVDPNGLTWAARLLADRPQTTLLVWADNVDTVAAMDRVLAAAAATRPIDVLVELGGTGGRTGARSIEEADRIAAAVTASDHLRLAGVAGYEGALAHDASAGAIAAVHEYLARLAEFHRGLLAAGTYQTDEIIVTAGGSAYFDDVAEVLGELATEGGGDSPAVRVLVRSGAYIIHDDGFYRTISPLSRAGTPLRSAMHAWARVVSRPEPGLALLDAGKRDIPFDEGLPEPQLVADDLGAPATPLTGAHVSAVNDQHAFLRIRADSTLRVGQVVRLGLSHPCTAFDKWRWIPVVPGETSGAATEADPVVVDLVRTHF